MTREERIEKLQHLITCMKCEVSGKSCDDNCPTQYAAGNMGEIIENLEEIVKALEREPCGKDINVPATDAISRQAAIDACLNGWNKDYKEIVKDIRTLPPVKPQEPYRAESED